MNSFFDLFEDYGLGYWMLRWRNLMLLIILHLIFHDVLLHLQVLDILLLHPAAHPAHSLIPLSSSQGILLKELLYNTLLTRILPFVPFAFQYNPFAVRRRCDSQHP